MGLSTSKECRVTCDISLMIFLMTFLMIFHDISHEGKLRVAGYNGEMVVFCTERKDTHRNGRGGQETSQGLVGTRTKRTLVAMLMFSRTWL